MDMMIDGVGMNVCLSEKKKVSPKKVPSFSKVKQSLTKNPPRIIRSHADYKMARENGEKIISLTLRQYAAVRKLFLEKQR